MIRRNVSGGPMVNADFLTDENIENIGGASENRGALCYGVCSYSFQIL